MAVEPERNLFAASFFVNFLALFSYKTSDIS